MHGMKESALLAALVAIVACGGNDQRRGASESARGDVTAGADTGMAAMDHSKMPGMGSDTAGAMAGMDHSKMPGMAPAAPGGAGGTGGAAASSSMAGMDHSKMPGMAAPARGATRAATPMAAMDHANMPGMAAPARDARTGTPAMDHANMPGMTNATGARPAAVPAGEAKLDQLVAALLNDPVIRERIQSDSALRRRWDDAAKLTITPTRPD